MSITTIELGSLCWISEMLDPGAEYRCDRRELLAIAPPLTGTFRVKAAPHLQFARTSQIDHIRCRPEIEQRVLPIDSDKAAGSAQTGFVVRNNLLVVDAHNIERELLAIAST